jgi:hypothetical protein
MHALLRKFIIVALLTGGWAVPASAYYIDFSDGYGNDLPAFSKTILENGAPTAATATFSNVFVEPGSTSGLFFANSLGLGLGSGGLGYSWDVVFNQTVNLTGWQTGFTSELFGSSGTFTITGTDVDFTSAFPQDLNAVFQLPSALTFLAGETYNFSSPNRCCDTSPDTSSGGVSFLQWHFESPATVPEPATWGLVALALAALGFRPGSERSAHKKTAV